MTTAIPPDNEREWLELEKLKQDIRTEMARRDHWRILAWILGVSAAGGLLGVGVSLVALVLNLLGLIGPGSAP